jgi:hypothetical protein
MVQPEAIALFGCNDYGIVMAVQALSETATEFGSRLLAAVSPASHSQTVFTLFVW